MLANIGRVLAVLAMLNVLIFVHEIGHASVQEAAGYRPKEIRIGSWGPAAVLGDRNLKLILRPLVPLGGLTLGKDDLFVDIELEKGVGFTDLQWMMVGSMLAGPIVSLAFGLLLLYFAQAVPRKSLKKVLVAEITSVAKAFQEFRMSGPIYTLLCLSQTSRETGTEYFKLAGQISVSWGILNLLPLPGLDGITILLTCSRLAGFKEEANRLATLSLDWQTQVVTVLIVLLTVNDGVLLFKERLRR